MKRNNIYLSLFIIFFISQNIMADVWVGYNSNSSNKSTKTTKNVTAGCSPATGSTYLELNNVKALIMTGGDMWWAPMGDRNAKYEVPKGSGKHSNFASSIWIGGTDINNQLRLCGMRYRDGYDFWPGPLVSSGDAIATVTSDVCRKYDRHYVISKKEVKEFRAWYEAKANGEEYDEEYTVPLSITEWPAHGPVEYGAYDWNLAPFRDLNGNGVYEPSNGEYPRFEFSDDILPCGTAKEQMVPRLYGDQTMWWVYNDNGNVHTETNGQAIGMELRGQAFAFSSNDELNNMTFYNFEIINRSTYTLKNTYFAVFTDADIGDASDDLCGCDVAKGLGFMYNADEMDGDGTGRTYGANPPAIGVDFFEGPFMDPSDDHTDRPSAYIIDEDNKRTDEWDPNAGPAEWYNGSINGLNFGDGVADNERWGMRRFIYFNNATSGGNTDPDKAIEYYNYLKGIWKDNSPLKYGGDGYSNSTNIKANFMFPGLSDEKDWGTDGITPPDKDWTGANSDNPGDKRFVHSAGPFTLMPGAINYITTGVVWARAYASNPYKSVELVIQADEKAQKLFENCFKTIDGPDAPELDFIEDNNAFIVNLWNKKGSNNYTETPEDYEEKSPFITCPAGSEECDKTFTFEGYIVYQLANKDVSINDIDNSDLARVVFQCDVKNDIANIVNYEYNANLQATEPKLKVVAENSGLKHSFKITKDLFASSTNNSLVNYKKYYYVAVAYAYNNYKTYDPNDMNLLDGQKEPFLIGRNNIKIFTQIPHPLQQNEGGTILNTHYGKTLEVSQLDGYGCGTNVLELKDETVNRILSHKGVNRLDSINYKAGHGPISVKVVDPLNVKEEDFRLCFYDLKERDQNNSENFYLQNGYIGDSKWYVLPLNTWGIKKTDTIFADTTNTDIVELIPVYGYDTIFSDNFITSSNEQTLIYNSTKYGLSVNISQTLIPGQNRTVSENGVVKFTIDKNGYLESSIEYKGEQWLKFVRDIDEGYQYKFNWIKSGKLKAGVGDTPYDDYTKDGKWYDGDEDFEGILNGSWAPGALVAEDYHEKASDNDLGTFPTIDDNGYFSYNGLMPNGVCLTENLFGGNLFRFSSVDIVITKDKSKWTRCPVVETCDNNFNSSKNSILPGESIGNTYKFLLRASKSVDKNGNTSESDEIDTVNVDSPNFMGSYGMGWFPGYAIDVETGERLNIMFGEDSHFNNQNSRDMIWNPTSDDATDLFWNSNGLKGELINGGKHVIYIMGRNYIHNEVMNEKLTYYGKSLGYDYGRSIHDTLSLADNVTTLEKKYNYAKNVYQNAMWVSIPMLRDGIENSDENDPYSFIKSDVKIRIRVANPYRKDKYSYVDNYDSLLNVYSNLIFTTTDPIGNRDFHFEKQIAAALNHADSLAKNGNLPMYFFSSKGLSAERNQTAVAEDALYKVNVVPNPYYAFNEYETSPIDHRIKFINLPNKCTIRIYNVGGTLIKTIKKDNNLTFTDWNLKNEYGISISGGVYIIHVDAPGVGEKVLKWFGALRPIDLNNF